MTATRRPRDPGLRMLPQEQRLAYALAAGAAVVFLIVWTPWNGGEHVVGFLLSLGFCASLAVVARQGHRLWTAFAAFLTGIFGPWGFAYIFGTPYVAFAFWLAWRAHRAVKASINADPSAPRATPMPAKKTSTIESGRVTPKGTAKRRSPKRTSRTR